MVKTTPPRWVPRGCQDLWATFQIAQRGKWLIQGHMACAAEPRTQPPSPAVISRHKTLPGQLSSTERP